MAKEKLRELEDQLAIGIYIPVKKIPTFKKFAQDWLEHKKLNVRASTWKAYECQYRNHLNEFNHLKITTITTSKVEKFLEKKQKDGMNLRTLKRVTVLLKAII